MIVALIALFLAGMGNFAMHRAVLDSRDPEVQAMVAPVVGAVGRPVMLAFEFALLLGAMLATTKAPVAALIVYGFYTIGNVMAYTWVTTRRH